MMIVALSAGFASCSNDDDEKNFDSANLVGTWQATHTEGWEQEVGAAKETWNNAWADKGAHMILPSGFTLKNDGTGIEEWALERPISITWKLDGKTLILTDEYDFSNVNVVELTEKTLVLEEEFEYKGNKGYEKVTYTRK